MLSVPPRNYKRKEYIGRRYFGADHIYDVGVGLILFKTANSVVGKHDLRIAARAKNTRLSHYSRLPD